MLSVIAFAVVIGGFLLTVQAADADTGMDEDTLSDVAIAVDSNYRAFMGEGLGGIFFGRRGFGGGLRGGPMNQFGGFCAVELSEELKQKVTSIAESDSDVQDLLSDGYTIDAIRPIIKRVVDADGYVTTKATSAIVVLKKDSSGASGFASVSVDIEAEKVTQVVILTRTVIDKS